MLILFKQLSLHLFLISTITKPAAVAPICTPGEAEGREWVLSQPELHWDFYASLISGAVDWDLVLKKKWQKVKSSCLPGVIIARTSWDLGRRNASSIIQY